MVSAKRMRMAVDYGRHATPRLRLSRTRRHARYLAPLRFARASASRAITAPRNGGKIASRLTSPYASRLPAEHHAAAGYTTQNTRPSQNHNSRAARGGTYRALPLARANAIRTHRRAHLATSHLAHSLPT